MAYEIPHSLIGTMHLRRTARADFGAFLDAVATRTPSTLLTEGSASIWQTLREKQRWRRWDVWALVPNLAGYIREATDYGLFGAGWRRLWRLHPLSWGRLGVQGLRSLGGIVRRDFPTLLTLLLEMEMASFRRVRPPVVFLHPQITDLLLAMDHAAALERAVVRIRRGFGAEPGLATNNLGTLLPRLRAWGWEVLYLLTPMHPRGLGMRPSQQACEESLRTFKGRVIATLEPGLSRNIVTYWKAQGVASALYDVPEPNLRDWESWKSWKHSTDLQPEEEGSAAPVVAARGGLL
jgi:hypothetical protein